MKKRIKYGNNNKFVKSLSVAALAGLTFFGASCYAGELENQNRQTGERLYDIETSGDVYKVTENLGTTGTGKFTPYSAVVVFAGASFLSNFIYNSYIMKHPFKGEPVTYAGYFKESARDHIIGVIGGVINATGTTFNIIASGMVGAAIAYALGQSNPMIAAIWGVFVWKEFKDAPQGTNKLIVLMFVFFAAGVALLTLAK